MSASSGAYTTASASSARISSTLFVATTPSGSMPMMSPTSLPALSAECTQQPASSRSGCSITPLMAATPTPPVAHCTTRSPISSPLYTSQTPRGSQLPLMTENKIGFGVLGPLLMTVDGAPV